MKVPASLEIDMCDALRDGHGSPRLVRIIERWFSKHEMVDLTVCGPQCPIAILDHRWYFTRCKSTEVGQPCPALSARKETT